MNTNPFQNACSPGGLLISAVDLYIAPPILHHLPSASQAQNSSLYATLYGHRFTTALNPLYMNFLHNQNYLTNPKLPYGPHSIVRPPTSFSFSLDRR